MRRKAVFAGLLALALGVPVFAAPASPVTAERAAQKIESARLRIEAAMAQHDMREVPVGERRGGQPRHEVLLARAQEELAEASEAYEQGDFTEADSLAYSAARLAWKASDPRKGEK